MNEGGAHPYVGRFAPSPTGPLHFGSLMAACASYLEARSHAGKWLLRIEDIDPPREQAGASDSIIFALESFGFEWDGPVIYQAESLPRHLDALKRLSEQSLTYRCTCSRRDLAGEKAGPLGVIYPGICRHKHLDTQDAAVRVRVEDVEICFDDLLQGEYCQSMARDSGDFVVHRRDGLIAYHLAVVVDDALQGISHIVRGIDLLESTPRQIWLQQLLGFGTPSYAHIPVAVHANGDKLSKLTGAPGLDGSNPGPALVSALRALKQAPPDALSSATLRDIWGWAIAHWDISRLRKIESIVT